MPYWAVTFHLIGVSAVFLTLVIVLFFLAPMQVMWGNSYFIMFTDDMFFFHLLNPVLCIISFTCLQKTYRFTRRKSLLGLIPAFIYSIVYLLMVVILKKWDDFYNFTFGGRYAFVPLVMLTVYVTATLLALLLIYLHNRNLKE